MLEGLLGPRSSSIAWPYTGCACETPRSRPRLLCTTQCTARVYIAATHLEGMERAESFLKIVGRGVQDVIALHTMTIVEEAVEGESSLKAYTLFDFLPLRATSPMTAASLLAGGKWPGLKRERKLKRIPKHRCKLIGEATASRAVEAARNFNASWDADIQLLRHDCHHHTAHLVHALTGQEVDVQKLFPLHQSTIWM